VVPALARGADPAWPRGTQAQADDIQAVPLSQWLKKVLLVLEDNFIVLLFGHLFEEDYL
jgi:hypothetical protein